MTVAQKTRASRVAAAALLAIAGLVPAQAATTVAPLVKPAFDGGNTAWLLICTVLVLLMTIPGLMLFYSGMLRTKNALSVVAHIFVASAVVTLTWCVLGYSLAFTPGNGWLGGLDRLFAAGLVGQDVGAHPVAPTVPESAFFLFQLSFAIIAFALITGATVERMRVGTTALFAALWTLLVYAPIAHWVWHPTGWLATMGHIDFAGGTVVHIAAGASGLAAAWMVGPRKGFGVEPMVPHNLLITVIGAGLLWAGWFGFNAGSAFDAGPRAVGAVLSTQVAASASAFTWGICEHLKRGQMSVLGMATGAIAGLIAITPASGYVGIQGALSIGCLACVVCFFTVTHFKAWTGIDDTLDVFALHGMGGLVGTVLVPVFALSSVVETSASVATNVLGAAGVFVYALAMTSLILVILNGILGLRVSDQDEAMGLDVSQHGEMVQPR